MAIYLKELASVCCCPVLALWLRDAYVTMPLPEVDLQLVLMRVQDAALQRDRVRMPRGFEPLELRIPRYEPVPVHECIVRMQDLHRQPVQKQASGHLLEFSMPSGQAIFLDGVKLSSHSACIENSCLLAEITGTAKSVKIR